MLTNNAGDTAWVLMCAVLMLFMTPGAALFYQGAAPGKNGQAVLKQCAVAICLVTLQWVLFGYSLAFGPDHNGWTGTLAWTALQGVGAEPNMEYSSTIPHLAFMLYQGMVAIVVPVLALTPFAGRLKFSAFCIFTLLWSTLVYDPVAHWLWGTTGFLRNSGALDFAGGAVIHLNAGLVALALGLILGKPGEDSRLNSEPNLPLMFAGAGMLWVGWFGLTGGRALGADSVAANACVMTLIAAATAGLIWALVEWALHKQATLFGILTGMLTGCIAVTPAAGYVSPLGALGIGAGAAIFCFTALHFLEKKFAGRDFLYVFSVHGVGGIWGLFATGLWATKTANANGADGLFYGHAGQMATQLKTTLAIALYAFGMSYALIKLTDYLIGLQSRSAENS